MENFDSSENNSSEENFHPVDVEHSREKSPKEPKPRNFNFWRGLTTALGAAFIVATLFTLWMPGSLIESGLEARMAQALE